MKHTVEKWLHACFAIVTHPSNLFLLNSTWTFEVGSLLDVQSKKSSWIPHILQAQLGIVVPL